jgi:hypothetical protein
VNPPAIVRSAESLASLGKKLKAYHVRNREENRQHGLYLLEAQELCQREGKSWLDWLEAVTGIAERTARRWMSMAKNEGREEEENGQVADVSPVESQNEDVSPQGDASETVHSPSAVQPPVRREEAAPVGVVEGVSEGEEAVESTESSECASPQRSEAPARPVSLESAVVSLAKQFDAGETLPASCAPTLRRIADAIDPPVAKGTVPSASQPSGPKLSPYTGKPLCSTCQRTGAKVICTTCGPNKGRKPA